MKVGEIVKVREMVKVGEIVGLTVTVAVGDEVAVMVGVNEISAMGVVSARALVTLPSVPKRRMIWARLYDSRKLTRPVARLWEAVVSVPVPAFGVKLTAAEPERVLPNWSMALIVTLKAWPIMAELGL